MLGMNTPEVSGERIRSVNFKVSVRTRAVWKSALGKLEGAAEIQTGRVHTKEDVLERLLDWLDNLDGEPLQVFVRELLAATPIPPKNFSVTTPADKTGKRTTRKRRA